MRNIARLLGHNDNIRTDHLKCDSCRTRVHLKRIEQSDGNERRLFECAHCGSIKSVRLAAPAAPRFVDNMLAFDGPFN
ncbi:MAG: hypothetical protein ABWY18_15355 [Tardiphaga sp.]